MTTKTTYVATAPDGSEYTRTTATKTYEWAVLAYSNGTWGVVSFNGRAFISQNPVESVCSRDRVRKSVLSLDMSSLLEGSVPEA